MARHRFFAAAGRDLRRALAQLSEQRIHSCAPPREIVRALDSALQQGHGRTLTPAC
jgi:hypothetical protein